MAGLEDHVTCSVCMDLYNDPLALPCLHSFCRHCIQGLFSSALEISCPECRTEVKLGSRGIDGLPRNFQLAGIVESYKKENDDVIKSRAARSADQTYCGEHKLMGEIYCRTCDKPLCLKCLTTLQHEKKHKMKPITRQNNSKRNDVMRSDTMCSDHEKPYKLVCGDCDTVVCVQCVIQRHISHKLASVEEIYEYNQEILKGILSELDARTRLLKATQNSCRLLAQKTQSEAQKKRQELMTYFTRMRDALDRKEAQMRSEIDRREQETVQTYMAKVDDAMRKEKSVSNVNDDIKSLMTENKALLIKHFNTRTQAVSDLLTDECTDSPPQLTGLLDATLVTCSFEKELNSIQWRWPKETMKPVRKAPPVPAKRQSITRKLRPSAPTLQQTSAMIKPGCPVNRGKDWHGGMTDGGPGHVGTVTAVMEDTDEGEIICTVRWPNGKTGQYRYDPAVEEIKPV